MTCHPDEKDLLVHDAIAEDAGLHLALANMEYPKYPIALGVIRAYAMPGHYDEAVEDQINEISASSKIKSVSDLLVSGATWEVK